jgi:hypothetical protein
MRFLVSNPPKSPFTKGGLSQPHLFGLRESLKIPPFSKGGSGGIFLAQLCNNMVGVI